MPRTKKRLFANFNLFDSYPSLILGAIIVIALGLLTANFFTKRNTEIGTGEKVSLNQEQQIKTQGGNYTIAEGDSLSTISEKLYESQEFWPVLARENNLVNPNIIYVGSTINAPSQEQVVEIKAQMAATSYQVQEGNTLFAVAEKMYGDGSRWQEIAKANNVRYLPNGNPLIFAGSTLTIPR